MRAAIFGAGSAGLLHGLSLRAHGVRIASVYDPDHDKARALAELLHGSRATRSDDAGDAEVVAICSPPSFHADQAVMFAREGRTVLLEKPVALDGGELDRISGLSRCFSALQWRFGRGLRAIRSAISAGELGEAPSVNVDLAWQRDDTYFRQRANWGCGMLLSVGIHAVDAALYALGDTVTSASATRSPSERETSACAWFVTSRQSRIALRLTSSALAIERASPSVEMAFVPSSKAARPTRRLATFDGMASRAIGHAGSARSSARRRACWSGHSSCPSWEQPFATRRTLRRSQTPPPLIARSTAHTNQAVRTRNRRWPHPTRESCSSGEAA